MRPARSYRLLQALGRGVGHLSVEARQKVCHYVESQRREGEVFMNRGREADLYYTMFGWMLCYALKIPSDRKGRKVFLEGIVPTRLDELHQTVLKICKMVDHLLTLPRFASPAVMRLTADDEPLLRFLTSYEQHGSGEGTNALAARLALSKEDDAGLAERLLCLQHETGGFLAHHHSLMPDLLSTAVALFALHAHSIPPRFDASPFIEAHWLDNGGFAPTLVDELSDTEYAFYGLLALGSLT
ncbi:MAG: hypothetical protein IKH26_06035 [Bacteroidaceae bacterium]|nr:hypothetical protein [Bacteroidaceae bacterium]